MTGEKAAEIVKSAFQAWESEYRCTGEDWSEEHEACEMAVKALTEESIPVDWINRFLDWLEKVNNDMSLRDAKGIRKLPSAQPERKKGKWIQNDNGTWSCDQCHSWIPDEQHFYARYCLYCGADMRGEADGINNVPLC